MEKFYMSNVLLFLNSVTIVKGRVLHLKDCQADHSCLHTKLKTCFNLEFCIVMSGDTLARHCPRLNIQ